jgi:hypothetical protein
MNEEELKLVRQIAKETIYEVLDVEVWDAIFELINAVEAGIASFKKRLAVEKGVTAPSWDPDKIKWEQAEGRNGPYERSEDVNNPEFKALLKDLARHGGRLTRNGWFYWTFKNGSAVGRKKRG